MGVIVDLIIIAIVALSTYLAYKKGLVALAIKLCAVVISIVITLLLYKPVSNLIINTTSIDETIQNAILEKATDVIRQEEESDLSNEVIDFAKDGVLDVKARELSIQIVNTGVIIILFLIIKFLLRFVTVIANKIAKGDYEISGAEYLQDDYKIFKSNIKSNKMCSFFDDLSSLKNCVMNALRNCEDNSNLLGWVRASDAIGDFTYPYVLENQEFCMEYISTTVIKYTKKLYIRMLVDGIQYYTDRYSWNAGGTITKSLKNKNQLIVDEFSDGAFQAYTVRLEEASQKEKIYIIDAEFFIDGCNYVEHQYLGLTNSFPVRNLTLCVRVANNLKLLECKYNMYGHSVDRVPKISKVIKPKSGIIEHTFKNLVIGERYNLEWRVVKK